MKLRKYSERREFEVFESEDKSKNNKIPFQVKKAGGKIVLFKFLEKECVYLQPFTFWLVIRMNFDPNTPHPMKNLLFLVTALLLSATALNADNDTLRVYFDSGNDEISGFQQSLIDIFATTHYAKGEIIVSGHTDNLGDSRSNLNFARNRAKLVAEYLLTQGVQSNKMVLEAWGETKPLLPNNTAHNRARNRRVEIIGIPNPEKSILDENFPSEKALELTNGEQVRYRQMTTASGNARRLWVIRLAKDLEMIPNSTASGNLGFWMRAMNCIRMDFEKECKGDDNYLLSIPTNEDMRCPLSEVQFSNPFIDALKQNFQDPKTALVPVLTDSGYAFQLKMPDFRRCYSDDFVLGAKCYSEQKATIRLDKLSLKSLRGNIKEIGQKVSAKKVDDQHLQIIYVNENPNSTIVFGSFLKGKHRRINLKPVPLDRLPKDASTGEYYLNKKVIKQLRKKRR